MEIADDHRRRVIWFVEGVEELADVLDGGLGQIRHAANRRVMVAVHGERSGAQIFLQVAVGLVLDAHAALFFHHFALGLKIFLADVEAAHAVRLEPQDALEIIAGKSFEEIGGVVGGFGVVESAYGFDNARLLLGWNVGRAFEHQVLKQVREASASGALVFPADVIPDLQVDDGDFVVFEQNYLQAVRERVRGVVDLGGADLRAVFFGSILLRSVFLGKDWRAADRARERCAHCQSCERPHARTETTAYRHSQLLPSREFTARSPAGWQRGLVSMTLRMRVKPAARQIRAASFSICCGSGGAKNPGIPKAFARTSTRTPVRRTP